MTDSEKLEQFMKEAKEEAYAAVTLADKLIGKDDILGRDLRESARSVMYVVNEMKQDFFATNANASHPAIIDDMKRVKKRIGELRDLVEYHRDPEAFKKRIRERQERDTPLRHHSIRYWLRVFRMPESELKQKLSSTPVDIQNIEEEIVGLESEQARLVKWFKEYRGNDDDYLKTAAWKLQLNIARLKRARGARMGQRAKRRWQRLSEEERKAHIQKLQAAKARSKRARTIDGKSNAKVVINPAKFNAPVEKWYKDPGKYDLNKIDTKPLTADQKRAQAKAQMEHMSGGATKRSSRRTGKKLGDEGNNRVMNVAMQRQTLQRMKGSRARKEGHEERGHDEYFLGDDETDWIDPTLTLDENWENQQANIRDYAMGYAAPASRPSNLPKKYECKRCKSTHHQGSRKYALHYSFRKGKR